MTRRIVFLPKARSDLSAIWRSTSERWGVDQADAYVTSMHRHVTTLSAKPLLGRTMNAIDERYRCHTSGSHVIYYRHDDDSLTVVRILHTRMDVLQHL